MWRVCVNFTCGNLAYYKHSCKNYQNFLIFSQRWIKSKFLSAKNRKNSYLIYVLLKNSFCFEKNSYNITNIPVKILSSFLMIQMS